MNFAAAIQAAIGADVSGMQAGGRQVEGIAGKMNSALGQIGVGLSFGAILGFFKSVTEKVGAIQDLSDRLEVGTDALQAFAYHAKQAGSDGDQASVLWDKARKSIDQLAAGEKAATEAFATLHLTQEDLMGLPLEQQVEKIAKAYQAAKGEAGAYDAVTDILGSKTAPRLMSVIDQLASQGLPAFTQAARDAGQVIEGETIAKIDEFGDRLDSLKGVLTTVGAFLLDSFLKLGEGIGQAAASIVNDFEGIQTNWDVTSEKAEKAAAATGKVTAKVAEHVAKASDLARLEQAQFKSVIDSLKPREAILALENRAVQLRVEAANAGKNSAEWAEKERQAVELFAQAERTRMQEREKGDKLALDLEEQAFEYAKQHAEQLTLEAKLKTGTINPQEKLRLDILRLQAKEMEVQVGLQYLLAKPQEQWTQQDKEMFTSLQRQSKELQRQIELKTGLIDKGSEQVKVEEAVAEAIHYGTAELKSFVQEWTGWKTAVSSIGRGDRQLSDRELERKEQNIKDDIFRRQIDQRNSGNYDGFLEQQKYNLAQLEAEQRLRESVRRDVSTFGEEEAFRRNSGLTESRFREILQGIDTTTQGRIANSLEKLTQQADRGFRTVLSTDDT